MLLEEDTLLSELLESELSDELLSLETELLDDSELDEEDGSLDELLDSELSEELLSLGAELLGDSELSDEDDSLDSEDSLLSLSALLSELLDSELSDELSSLLDSELEVALLSLSLDEDSESELSPSLDEDSEISDELLGVEELLSLEEDSSLDSELELSLLLESELVEESELADEVDDSLDSEDTLLSLSELLDSELPEELLTLESELESEPVLKSSGTMAAMETSARDAAAPGLPFLFSVRCLEANRLPSSFFIGCSSGPLLFKPSNLSLPISSGAGPLHVRNAGSKAEGLQFTLKNAAEGWLR